MHADGAKDLDSGLQMTFGGGLDPMVSLGLWHIVVLPIGWSLDEGGLILYDYLASNPYNYGYEVTSNVSSTTVSGKLNC